MLHRSASNKVIDLQTASKVRVTVEQMVWFKMRNQQTLTLETRYDNATNEYVGILTGLGGPPVTKRFATPYAFREWLETLEHDLAKERWTPDGAHVLPDGWRDKPWSL